MSICRFFHEPLYLTALLIAVSHFWGSLHAVLDCLFAVAAADNNITSEEDGVVKQISEELKLYHSDYIAARLKFKQYLAVLKLGKSQEEN
jgi:hypothetical protein